MSEIDGSYSTIQSGYSVSGGSNSILIGEEGHYPATWSFEDDADYSDPDGWTIDETYGSVNIYPELDGHNKIVEINDTSAVGGVYFETAVFMTYGTIEYWMRTTDASLYNILDLRNSGARKGAFVIFDDKFRYNDGSWNDVGLGASSNTWYHIRIDFECDDNGYMGLDEDEWVVYIDGIKYGSYSFVSDIDEIDEFNFFTATGAMNYKYYIDAVGIYPTDRIYDFKHDVYGNNPTGWVDESTGSNDVTIVDEIGGRQNVLNLHDIDGSQAIAKISFPDQINGTIEFDLRSTDSTKMAIFHIYDGTTLKDQAMMDDGWIMEYTGSWTSFIPADNDRWYHIKIDFNVDSDTWVVSIDGVNYGNFTFHDTATKINTFRMKSQTSDVGYDSYWDNFKFSWMTDYQIGDNLHDTYYAGTEDFEGYNVYGSNWYIDYFEGLDGSDPVGWTVTEVGGTVNIISEGQNKIAELQSNSVATTFQMTDTITDGKSKTIKVRQKVSVTDKRVDYIIFDGDENNAIYIAFYQGHIQYYDSSFHIIKSNFVADTWYNFEIQYDCGTSGDGSNDWHLWLDGVQTDSGGYSFRGNPTDMDNVRFNVLGYTEIFSYYE